MSISRFPLPASSTPSSSPSPATSSPEERLWRPGAQRNLRNQWSKLSSCRQQWIAACSGGRSHATSLVNAYLSQKYMPLMELGALSDMPDIRKKALEKLSKQQSLRRSNLLSSYKEMVTVVVEMVNARRSMRWYVKTSCGPLVQSSIWDANDAGDCGGVPVYSFSFSFWTISAFEQAADELVEMYRQEVVLKRLLVLELLSLSSDSHPGKFPWSAELYHGEFDDLTKCSLHNVETCEPVLPRSRDEKSGIPAVSHDAQPTRETLQIYLATWLAEVNVDTQRVDEIFALAGEEMRVAL